MCHLGQVLDVDVGFLLPPESWLGGGSRGVSGCSKWGEFAMVGRVQGLASGEKNDPWP